MSYRRRTNGASGTLTADPGATGTTLNSAGFASLPALNIFLDEVMVLTLDPLETAGELEIVLITSHTASATSLTVARGWEGTTGRAHAIGVAWAQGATKEDFDAIERRHRAHVVANLYR